MKDHHFKLLFWFVVSLCGFAALLTMAIIFLPLPKGNERFADQGLLFWLTSGAGSGIGFLIGSSLQKRGATQQAENIINAGTPTP